LGRVKSTAEISIISSIGSSKKEKVRYYEAHYKKFRKKERNIPKPISEIARLD